MKTAIAFTGESRENLGKGAARTLRREGRIPAILYGRGSEPLNITLPEKEIQIAYRKGGFFSKIVSIDTGKGPQYALPKDIQLHPVTDRIEHADFLRVDEDSEITVKVRVRFRNQDRCIGIKRGGVLNVVRHDIGLVCKPAAIPESIEIDLLNANIGDSIHISHISLPEGVRPEIRDRDFTIATIAGRSKQSDDVAEGATAAVAEGEVKAAE